MCLDKLPLEVFDFVCRRIGWKKMQELDCVSSGICYLLRSVNFNDLESIHNDTTILSSYRKQVEYTGTLIICESGISSGGFYFALSTTCINLEHTKFPASLKATTLEIIAEVLSS
jgi:hypothetical protein